MNYYISFCYSETVGGGQNYLNSKTAWLEKKGWKPLVFTANRDYRYFNKPQRTIPWDNLRRFSCYKSVFISMPPEFWPGFIVKRELKKMAALVHNDAEQVIVESNTDFWAEWGELLAQKLSARNFCFLIDELLESYGAKEFLLFKFQRREVAGIHKTSMHRLFDGILDIPCDDTYVLRAMNEGAVADVASKAISCIAPCDYTLGYIGRNKQYTRNIRADIIGFAKKHPEKTVCLVVVGEAGVIPVELPANLSVVQLGFLVPIPRSLFSILDVVIAGAGCARLAACEGVPVIVADAGTSLASGVLGYTVNTTLFSDSNPRSFCDVLEDVLINDSLSGLEICPFQRPDISIEYEKHFSFISESSPEKQYFDFKHHPQRSIPLKRKIKTWLKWHWPSFYKRLFLRK